MHRALLALLLLALPAGAALARQSSAPPITTASSGMVAPVAISPEGDGFLVADPGAHVVWRVSAAGARSVAAGVQGVAGTGGETVPPVGTPLNGPRGVQALAGGFAVSDTGNNRVRLVDGNGTISTIAGTGAAGFGGDGGTAIAARLNGPRGLGLVRTVLVRRGQRYVARARTRPR